jgi:hypothetical protein
MAITGVHTVLYSPESEALRDALSNVFGFSHVDAGRGWLIFALPPAEMALHPSDEARHEVSLMCDDLDATMADLATKGVDFEGTPSEQRWGISITMVLPGGVHVMLYQPHHPTAF